MAASIFILRNPDSAYLVSLREKMKRRMKTRNVVCDEFIMGTHWKEKSSLSSKFNFRSPLDSLTNFMSGFWTSDDLFVIVVNCHKPPNDHIMFSETRLWKELS